MLDSNDELTYLCGGEVNAGEFSIDITSEDLQPTEITALIGLQPTSHHLQGDAFGSLGHKFKFGRWRYSSGRLDFRAGRCFEQQFDDFIRALPNTPAIWGRIAAHHEAVVNVCLWMRTWNREFGISSFALGELAHRRLRLHVDTYFEADTKT